LSNIFVIVVIAVFVLIVDQTEVKGKFAKKLFWHLLRLCTT